MSNAIAVCASNLPPWWSEISEPRIAEYARRCGAQFRVVTPEHWRGVVSRGVCIRPVVHEFERTLVIDADVVISREAPNIFDSFPKTGNVRMALDAKPGDEIGWNRIDDIVAIQAMCGGVRWTKRYYNAGVVLCDRMHTLVWDHWVDFVPEMWPDQANINYFAHKYYRVEALPREWNSFGMNNGFLTNPPDALIKIAHGSHIAHAAGFADRDSAIRKLDELMP